MSEASASMTGIRALLLRRLFPYGVILFLSVLVGSLIALFARLDWRADLATHFVPIYAIGAFVATILLAAARRRHWAAASAALCLVHVALLVPYFPRPFSGADASPRLRVLCVNVHTENTNHAPILDYALASDADIIGVQEVNHRWVSELAPLEEKYPYSIKSPRADNFGIALYSRLPVSELRVDYLQPHNLDTIVGAVQLNDITMHLRVIHALPPIGASNTAARNSQIEMIAAWARDNHPCIVFGDFNTAMWSPAYRNLVREGKLSNARHGRGVLGTWPAQFFPLTIPIDHCLVSPGIIVIDCNRGPAIGSDHFPLLIDVTLAEH